MVATLILIKYVHHIQFVRSHSETKKILMTTPKLVNYVQSNQYERSHSETK